MSHSFIYKLHNSFLILIAFNKTVPWALNLPPRGDPAVCQPCQEAVQSRPYSLLCAYRQTVPPDDADRLERKLITFDKLTVDENHLGADNDANARRGSIIIQQSGFYTISYSAEATFTRLGDSLDLYLDQGVRGFHRGHGTLKVP